MWWKMGLLPQSWRLKTRLSPCQPAKVMTKNNRFSPKVMLCVWQNSEGVIHCEFVPNGCAVDVDPYSQQLERVHKILRWRYPALVNKKEFYISRRMRDPILHEQPWQKFRNWEESNCYHTQLTALILHLQITICFNPWAISCMQEISKTLKWVSLNSSHQEPRLLPSRDNKPRWKKAQNHRIWWSLLWRVV